MIDVLKNRRHWGRGHIFIYSYIPLGGVRIRFRKASPLETLRRSKRMYVRCYEYDTYLRMPHDNAGEAGQTIVNGPLKLAGKLTAIGNAEGRVCQE